eukprot:403351209
MVTSSMLAGLGDALCQNIQNRFLCERLPQTEGSCELVKLNTQSFDFLRNMRLCTYGFFISGPLMHYIYTKVLPVIGPGCSLKSVLIKVLFTQTIFTVFGISLFYFTLSLMSGMTLEASQQEVREKLIPTYMTSLKIWPIMSFINFMFVPAPLQVASSFEQCRNYKYKQ